MTDTQKRIKAYKAALPELRERVIAVAMLLVMSLSMMVSATFAWVTLSTAPEVSGAATQLAANGNLEIALAGRHEVKTDENGNETHTLMKPEESAVGDSSATEGQSIVNANLTWGNLVNLSDASYGLDNIVLRPATLNTSSLGTNPFRSAVYGEDGRVINSNNEDFSYCIWEEATEGSIAKFSVTDKFGVRAVSTVTKKYEADAGADASQLEDVKTYNDLMEKVSSAKADVRGIYPSKLQDSNKNYMNDLCSIIGLYLTKRFNSGEPSLWDVDCGDYLQSLDELYDLFGDAMFEELEAMAELANAQQFVYFKNQSYIPYAVKTSNPEGTDQTVKLIVPEELSNKLSEIDALFEELETAKQRLKNATGDATQEALANLNAVLGELETAKSELDTIRNALKGKMDTLISSQSADGVHLTGLKQFVVDYATIRSDAVDMRIMRTRADSLSEAVLFSELESYVNVLVTINTCIVHTSKNPPIVVDDLIKKGAMDASGYLENGMSVEIADGILARFEQKTGEYIRDGEYSVSVKVKRYGITLPVTVNSVKVYTVHRDKNNLYQDDRDWTQNAFNESGLNKGKLIETAGDTYGLAIDLWVRTNASGAQGDDATYLTLEGKVIYDVAPGEDENGNEKGELFYYEETDELTGETTRTYVYRYDNLYYENGTSTQVNNLAGKTLTQVYADAPIGYEGENRVWEEWQQAQLSPGLSEFNTTQGAGSCFTFYADTPTEEQAILNLLSHMRVVFTDGADTNLATASFDTAENHYYRVGGKVTVPLAVTFSNYRYTNEAGEGAYAITALERNEATRITALVYLDGADLSNKEALSASDIKGTLNIQFGSSSQLQTLGDKELQEAERIVTASVKTAKSDNVLSFFEDTDLSANVEVTVTGDQPTKVEAFFQREINSAQGSREEVMRFDEEGGVWKHTYTFDAPGNYVLRSVLLDGVYYELAEPQRVTVEGFKVTSLSLMRNDALLTGAAPTIVTADNSVTLDLSVTTSSDASRNPSSVKVVFLRGDATTVTADLSLSGGIWIGKANLSSSGVYTMANALIDGEYYPLDGFAKELTVYMGMKAAVYTQTGTPQVVPLGEGESRTLGIRAQIRDNAGNFLEGQEDVYLYYRSSGQTLEAKLEWKAPPEGNNQRGYYEGNFRVTEAGTYTFSYLTVGDSYVDSATTYPTFNVFSNSPVSYEGCTNDGTTTFAMAGDDKSIAYMNLQIKNSGGAVIRAYFTDTNGNERVVQNTETDSSFVKENGVLTGTTIRNWQIKLPDTDGDQGGTWTLRKIEITNVSNEKGEQFTSENGMYLTLVPETLPTVKVISQFEIVLENASATFGNTTDAAFMTSYAKNDFAVSIHYMDGETKKALPDTVIVSDVNLTYKHQGDSLAKGGYTSNVTVPDITVALNTKGADGMTYTSSAAATFQIAGTYKVVSGSVKVNSKEYPISVSNNSVVVSSAKPTVSISATTPNKTHTAINTSDKDATVTSGFVGNTATVYCETNTGLNGKITTHPTVTLTLNNMGNAESAAMQFTASNNGTVYMYTGQSMSGQTNAFTWQNGVVNCQRFIGQYRESNSCRGMTRTGAGTLTASTITLTYAGVAYTVSNDTITISNPY